MNPHTEIPVIPWCRQAVLCIATLFLRPDAHCDCTIVIVRHAAIVPVGIFALPRTGPRPSSEDDLSEDYLAVVLKTSRILPIHAWRGMSVVIELVPESTCQLIEVYEVKHIHTYYSPNDLYNRIIEGLHKLGKDLSKITLDDLQPVDEFHIRGDAATKELIKLSSFTSDMHILDVGCGIGGSTAQPG